MKEHALEDFRHASLLFQVRTAFGGSKEKPPLPPSILREIRIDE
jgi:hypothetical protein